MAFLNRLGLRLASQSSLRQISRASGKNAQIVTLCQTPIAITRPFHYASIRFAERQGDVAEASGSVEQESVTRAVDKAQGEPRTRTPRQFQGEIFDPEHSIHVAGLNYHTTKETAEKAFSEFGNVVSSKLLTTPEGLSRGVMFIKFDSPEAATLARNEMNSQLLDGRRISVNVPESRRTLTQPRQKTGPAEPTETLFIGNMNYAMSNEDLNALFKNVRNVTNVRVAIDRRTGQPRGFAHADFIDVESAEKARVELDGKNVHGRNLRVDFAPSSNRLFKSRTPSRDRPQSDDPVGDADAANASGVKGP